MTASIPLLAVHHRRGARQGRQARLIQMPEFKLNPAYSPTADQPKAIDGLAEGIESKEQFQTLLGATGTGKTFTMAATIERVQRPALVIAHNKTLAAQLCNEFREFFPENAVEYFVSYYDYYQPEAYVPAQDLYIEKDSSINDEIDRLRHSGNGVALRPPRRDHRRLGLLHLRDRLAAALPGADAALQGRRLGRPPGGLSEARRHAVPAQRLHARPRHVPGSRRGARDLPGVCRVRASGSSSSATRSRPSSTSTR